MASLRFVYLLVSLFIISVNHVVLASVHLELEDGYAVTTAINGDEHQINPHSVLPLFESSDLIVLDSSRSTFYTLSFNSSQGGVVKKLSGNGVAGYADGELGSAVFNKPKSFAVDIKGNVYVADRFKHTIRKISKSGVTTIAGGYSQTTGKNDGPAQNASFSDDFELAFIPERCALMISDHGNRLVRQMKLKAEDCTHGSHLGVGMTSFWVLGLGVLSCLLGMVMGFVFRPYVTSRTGRTEISNLQQDMEPLLNKSEETSGDAVLRYQKHSDHFDETYFKNTRPLLDTNYTGLCEITKLQLGSLKDLIMFDDLVESCDVAKTIHIEDEDHVSAGGNKKIECLIRANMFGFMEQTRTTLRDESLDCYNGQIKLKAM